MKNIFFSVLCLILTLSLCLICLCSCFCDNPSAKDVLAALTAAEIGLPAGNIYLSDAPEGSENYTSSSLLCALYGGGGIPKEHTGWIEFAIFLSRGEIPCELAVFLCSSPTSASDTAKMLCIRLDTLRHAWKKTPYSDRLNAAEIIISGNLCLMLVSSDVSAAKKTALSLIS